MREVAWLRIETQTSQVPPKTEIASNRDSPTLQSRNDFFYLYTKAGYYLGIVPFKPLFHLDTGRYELDKASILRKVNKLLKIVVFYIDAKMRFLLKADRMRINLESIIHISSHHASVIILLYHWSSSHEILPFCATVFKSPSKCFIHQSTRSQLFNLQENAECTCYPFFEPTSLQIEKDFHKWKSITLDSSWDRLSIHWIGYGEVIRVEHWCNLPSLC